MIRSHLPKRRENKPSRNVSRVPLQAAVSFGVEALETRRMLSAGTPNAPTDNHYIGGSETSVSFHFTDNASDETGFTVQRRAGGGSNVPYLPFATLPANPGTGVVTYTDNTVSPGIVYSYIVTAVNANGPSAPTLFASASVTPGTPYAFSGTAISPTSVQLTFFDGSNVESGYSVVENDLTHGGQGSRFDFPAHAGTGFVTEAVGSLSPGTTYQFFVSVLPSGADVGPVTITTSGTLNGASISGIVTGNPGVEQVYLDLQGVGNFVSGDPIVTTDAQGKYAFTGLNPGNYLVRIKPQVNTFTTSPVWGGKYFTVLAANQAVTGDDFTVKSLPSFAIGNQSLVYGTQTDGSNYLERFNVDGTIDSTFGQRLIAGQSDTNVFHASLPGTVTGNPMIASAQANDNIVVTYPTKLVTLDTHGVILSINDRVNIGGSISGTVFTDFNGDGIRNSSEIGYAGLTVYLDINGVGSFANTDPIAATDANGQYTFSNLAAGNYLVRIVRPVTTNITTPVWGGKFFVQLGTNQQITGDDFGIKTPDAASVTQADGKILDVSTLNDVNGFPSDLILLRFNADGTVDPTFGVFGTKLPSAFNIDGGLTTVKSLLPRSDGSTLVFESEAFLGGNSTLLTLVSAGGQITRTITGSTFANSIPPALDTLSTVSIGTDGKILAAGFHYASFIDRSTQLLVKRYNNDLTPDTTFAAQGVDLLPKVPGTPMAVTTLPDGRIQVTYSDKTVNLTSSGVLI